MGVRVDPADLPDHLVLQHQHNLNRGAEADAQFAPIAASANMMAYPVRQLGYFGGPIGASAGEGVAQTIEQAGGARQGYDPVAIGEQALVPMAVGAAGKLARSLRKPPGRMPPTAPPTIAPVPRPQLGGGKPIVQGSYFGPERRSMLTQTQAAEEQISRMAQRRRATDPLEWFTEGSYYRVTGREPLGNFVDTMDRTSTTAKPAQGGFPLTKARPSERGSIKLTPDKPESFGDRLNREAYESAQQADTAFRAKLASGAKPVTPLASLGSLIKQHGREKVSDMLYEFDNFAQLSPDGKFITTVADPRNMQGKVRVPIREFMSWVAERESTP